MLLTLVLQAVLTLLATLSTPLLACSCRTPQDLPRNSNHPQSYFCHSDFVVAMQVKKRVVPFSRARVRFSSIVYKIRIKKVFKSSAAFKKANKRKLWTEETSSLCGVELQLGTRYVVAGEVVAGKLFISMCNSWSEEWRDVGHRLRKGLRREFISGCDCKIETCPARGSYCPHHSNKCRWTTSPYTSPGGTDCQGLLSTCQRTSAGKCDWSPSSTYRRCMKSRRWSLSQHGLLYHQGAPVHRVTDNKPQ